MKNKKTRQCFKVEYQKKIYRIKEDWDAYFSLVGDTKNEEDALFDSIRTGECYSFWELTMYLEFQIDTYYETSKICLNTHRVFTDVKEDNVMLVCSASYDGSNFAMTDKGVYVRDEDKNIAFTPIEECTVSEIKNDEAVCCKILINGTVVDISRIERDERDRFVMLLEYIIEAMKRIKEFRKQISLEV